MRSRVYRMAGLLFAAAGLVVFIVLYLQQMDGDLSRAFREPFFVVMLLVPFLPAAFLSIVSRRLERKYLKMVDQIKAARTQAQ
ncbi:MAG: hypothetical protein EOM26_04630 [Alphaproteobacteria bacterium]|nr:hypothetical protein [Alphaproteobacteria bacterium]